MDKLNQILENKPCILYNGDYSGKYMVYMGEFKSKKKLIKTIKEHIPTRYNLDLIQVIDWRETKDNDKCIDLSILYGDPRIALLIAYCDEED